MQDVIDSLGFDGQSDCIAFLNHYFINVAVVQDKPLVYLGRKVIDRNGKKERIYPKYPYSIIPDNLPLLKSNVVEAKRHGISYIDVLDGKFNHIVQKPSDIDLPGFVSPVKAHAPSPVSLSLKRSPLFKNSPSNRNGMTSISSSPSNPFVADRLAKQAEPTGFSFMNAASGTNRFSSILSAGMPPITVQPQPVSESKVVPKNTTLEHIAKSPAVPSFGFVPVVEPGVSPPQEEELPRKKQVHFEPVDLRKTISKPVIEEAQVQTFQFQPVLAKPLSTPSIEQSPAKSSIPTISFTPVVSILTPTISTVQTKPTVPLARQRAAQEEYLNQLLDQELRSMLLPIAKEIYQTRELEPVIERVFDQLLRDCVKEFVTERVVMKERLTEYRNSLQLYAESIINEVIQEELFECINENLESQYRIESLERFGWDRWRFFIRYRTYLKEKKHYLGQRMLSFLRQAALVPKLVIPPTPVRLAVKDEEIETQLVRLSNQVSLVDVDV
jgi:hypothetical protein